MAEDRLINPAQRAAIKRGLIAFKAWWFGQDREPDTLLDDVIDAIEELNVEADK